MPTGKLLDRVALELMRQANECRELRAHYYDCGELGLLRLDWSSEDQRSGLCRWHVRWLDLDELPAEVQAMIDETTGRDF